MCTISYSGRDASSIYVLDRQRVYMFLNVRGFLTAVNIKTHISRNVYITSRRTTVVP
jgi:hypothetical protein